MLALMFERLRFVRYALKFERAFKTDDWTEVKACFHPDGAYVVVGSGTRYDGVHRGRDAIADVFKRMLDEVDRKYERRRPGLAGWPRVEDGELVLPWKARYSVGERSTLLTGTSRCRWQGGLILELEDTMVPAEVKRWAELVGVSV